MKMRGVKWLQRAVQAPLPTLAVRSASVSVSSAHTPTHPNAPLHVTRGYTTLTRIGLLSTSAHLRYSHARHVSTATQYSSQTNTNDSRSNRSRNQKVAVVLIAGALAITLFVQPMHADNNEQEEEEEEEVEYVARDWSHLPYFELDDVAKHKTLETGVWVFFEDGVYDITEFIELHPGGKKILEAAGSSIAPFWLQYRQHDHPTVREVLADLRIGNLKNPPPEAYIQTVAANAQRGEVSSDPYQNEPMRTAEFIISMLKPFNAEPKLDELTKCYLTPNSHFFVRNHLPVPRVNPETYRLRIGGEGRPIVEFTLEDLKTKFAPRTIVSTIQCAGNRRSEINAVAKVQGLDWQGGAISTAVFTGARLRDVLASVGLTDEEIEKEEYKHIQFEGYDKDATGSHYGASILINKIESKKSDVILAYEMNGEPIPLDHGFPVRAIVPGVVGARNVKWLSSVLLSENESQSHWQQNDYKGFGPNITFKDADYKSGYSIQELPVTSVICEPPNNAKVKPGDEIAVKGYAWSGGGRKILRVDISPDGGKTWEQAELQDGSTQPLGRAYAWTFWSKRIKVPSDADTKQLEVCCKAVDESYNVQPDTVAPQWNLRGVLTNAWHRVKINVANAPPQHPKSG